MSVMMEVSRLFKQESFPRNMPFKQNDSFSRQQPMPRRDLRTSRHGVLNCLQEIPAYSGADVLSSNFIIVNRRATRKFIDAEKLLDVLLQSEKHIDAAFGKTSVKTLAIVEDDEGQRTLFCLVAFSGTLPEAQASLRSFDQNWWLNNARRFGSKLNFDFELV
jgi:hypothetical protein